MLFSARLNDKPEFPGMQIDMPNSFGTRIRRLRNDQKINQSNAAASLGISAGHLSSMENNAQKPSLDLIKAMAELYGTTVHHLLFGELPEEELVKRIQDEEKRVWFSLWGKASPEQRKQIKAIIMAIDANLLSSD